MNEPPTEPPTEPQASPLDAAILPRERPAPSPSRHASPVRRGPYAALIATCRRGASLSRAELGQRIGVPEATIQLWEDPSYEGIDLAILERVAKASGRTLQVSFVRERRAGATVPSEPWPAPLERTA